MGNYIFVIYIIAGILLIGAVVTVFLNLKARKNKQQEPSECLSLSSYAFWCIAGVFVYYAYWLFNNDALRLMFKTVLGCHALLMFLLILLTSRKAYASENLPGVIRATLITFVVSHIALPAFPLGEKSSYVVFRLINDDVVATIGLMIGAFLLIINIILMIAQLVMYFKARRF